MSTTIPGTSPPGRAGNKDAIIPAGDSAAPDTGNRSSATPVALRAASSKVNRDLQNLRSLRVDGGAAAIVMPPLGATMKLDIPTGRMLGTKEVKDSKGFISRVPVMEVKTLHMCARAGMWLIGNATKDAKLMEAAVHAEKDCKSSHFHTKDFGGKRLCAFALARRPCAWGEKCDNLHPINAEFAQVLPATPPPKASAAGGGAAATPAATPRKPTKPVAPNAPRKAPRAEPESKEAEAEEVGEKAEADALVDAAIAEVLESDESGDEEGDDAHSDTSSSCCETHKSTRPARDDSVPCKWHVAHKLAEKPACKFADKCSFSHELVDAAVATGSCVYALTDRCNKGEACTLTHRDAAAVRDAYSTIVEERRETARRAKELGLCVYFVQFRCQKGKACKFPHKSAREVAEAWEQHEAKQAAETARAARPKPGEAGYKPVGANFVPSTGKALSSLPLPGMPAASVDAGEHTPDVPTTDATVLYETASVAASTATGVSGSRRSSVAPPPVPSASGRATPSSTGPAGGAQSKTVCAHHVRGLLGSGKGCAPTNGACRKNHAVANEARRRKACLRVLIGECKALPGKCQFPHQSVDQLLTPLPAAPVKQNAEELVAAAATAAAAVAVSDAETAAKIAAAVALAAADPSEWPALAAAMTESAPVAAPDAAPEAAPEAEGKEDAATAPPAEPAADTATVPAAAAKKPPKVKPSAPKGVWAKRAEVP